MLQMVSFMTIGAGVSRWTMLHLGAAMIALLLAQALIVWGYVDPINALRAPETLVGVHLMTIGWLSLLMLGALYQFVPVITNSNLFSQNLPIIGFVSISIGLCGMVAGFVALGGNDLVPLACLPVGGTLVLIGLVIGAFNIGATLWNARPLPIQAYFVAAGIGFLLLTGTMGLIFALALTLPSPSGWLTQMLQQGLIAHVAAGLGGWFTLTAMGVSYRLLSMFMLAPEEASRSTYTALILTPAGLLITMAGALFSGGGERISLLVLSGAAMAGLGIVFYLADVSHLYHIRKRRHLELNSMAAAAALGCLALSVLATAVVVVTKTFELHAGALGYLFVFGWLSGLGLSQLYKIVPFMTWLDVFGKRLGKGPVPRVQDLVEERRARHWFVLYFGSVIVATVAVFFSDSSVFLFASYVQLAATGLIGFELWQARHPDPNAKPKMPMRGSPLPFDKPKPSLPQTHGD